MELCGETLKAIKTERQSQLEQMLNAWLNQHGRAIAVLTFVLKIGGIEEAESHCKGFLEPQKPPSLAGMLLSSLTDKLLSYTF